GILHPLIGQETMRRFGKLGEEGKEFAVYEATLLVENKLHQAQDGLIVVTAPLDRMLARVRARDGLDEKSAMARISAQLPQEVKAKVADFVIHNDGDLNALARQVAELLVKLRAGYTRNHG
ncbi:MAG: dephospho-CoA kinase, partial [Deltaproteobacteria bacterium]|nr:dephospho-CoA kinase [Deltaproteobacteria bacterium]